MTTNYAAKSGANFFHIIVRTGWIVCALAILSTGCASTPKYLRWYDGPPLESQKVAVVKIHQDPWHSCALVEAIDGAPIRKAKGPEFNNTETLELLPGKHQLEVSYLDSNGGHSISDATIEFTSEEGHSYELFVAPENRTSGQVLGSMFFGGKFHWTAWIIDCESKKVVAGEKWEQPARRYQ